MLQKIIHHKHYHQLFFSSSFEIWRINCKLIVTKLIFWAQSHKKWQSYAQFFSLMNTLLMESVLEQRQNKNNPIQSKMIPILILPRFSPHRIGVEKARQFQSWNYLWLSSKRMAKSTLCHAWNFSIAHNFDPKHYFVGYEVRKSTPMHCKCKLEDHRNSSFSGF